MTTLPKALALCLPARERRSPSLELHDGRWLAAAKSGLYVFGAGSASDEKAQKSYEVFPWYDVARAQWEAEAESFTLEWVDPTRPSLVGRGQGDPSDFMRHTSEYVNRSIVVHAQVETEGRTTVTAWVRRGPDGLFSILAVAALGVDAMGHAAFPGAPPPLLTGWLPLEGLWALLAAGLAAYVVSLLVSIRIYERQDH